MRYLEDSTACGGGIEFDQGLMWRGGARFECIPCPCNQTAHKLKSIANAADEGARSLILPSATSKERCDGVRGKVRTCSYLLRALAARSYCTTEDADPTEIPLNASIAAARTSAMEEIRSIVDRLPQRELDIRRRCSRDAYFRSVCVDYEEAAAALRYWRKVAKEGDQKVEEYTQFLGELEAEILGQLDRRPSSH